MTKECKHWETCADCKEQFRVVTRTAIEVVVTAALQMGVDERELRARIKDVMLELKMVTTEGDN